MSSVRRLRYALPFVVVAGFILLEISVPWIAKLLGRKIAPNNLSLFIVNSVFILIVVALHFFWTVLEKIKDRIEQSLVLQSNAVRGTLEKLIVSSRLVPIPRANLYTTLQELAEQFERKAWNCWFHVRPPNSEHREGREAYFKKLLERAQAQQEPELKRLVLGTHDNVPWIAELIKEYSSLDHVSLAVYCRDDTPLSVQIFDHRRGLIVNPYDIGDTHDLLIEDDTAVGILQHYFDALWGRSWVVLDRGLVQQDNMDKVRRGCFTPSDHRAR